MAGLPASFTDSLVRRLNAACDARKEGECAYIDGREDEQCHMECYGLGWCDQVWEEVRDEPQDDRAAG